MSSTLYWKPVSENKGYLSDDLKRILQKRYGGTIHSTMSIDDMEYVNGLIDAGVDGAEKLKELIYKHEIIELNEEY